MSDKSVLKIEIFFSFFSCKPSKVVSDISILKIKDTKV